jgi:uncharacterized protein (UPF0332 family)
MTFDDLVNRRMIERTSVSDDEIAEHLGIGRHDIELAQLVSTQDLDWSFNIAYNGILQTATAYMRFKGYRPRGEAKHYNTFVFLARALPAEYVHDIDRVQKMRTKRNQAVYDTRGAISEKEVKDILDFAQRFTAEITELLPERIVALSKETGAEPS